jgi:hypothetical protein
MSDFLLLWITGVAVTAAAVAVVLGMYFLARLVLHPGGEGDKTQDVANAVAFRLAALHGLILALVYAQELDDYKDVRSGLAEEAVAVADVYNDARRYGGPEVAAVQAGLARYLTLVVNEEWTSLGQGDGLSPKAWIQWDDVYNRLLNLTPADDRQRYLAGRMRDRVTAIARFRQMRETTAAGGFGGLFWAPALIGLFLLPVPFYVFRPSRSHLVLLSIFGAYSGIILFFIYVFSDPFDLPGRLEPVPFQHLLHGDIGKSLIPP